VLLLWKLEEWARRLGGQFEELVGGYEDLLLDGVVFPQCVNSVSYMLKQRFGQSPGELVKQLKLSLSKSDPNTVEVVEMGKLLCTFQEALSRSLQKSSTDQNLESQFALYLEIDEVLTALNIYEQQAALTPASAMLLAQVQQSWTRISEPQCLAPPYLPEDEAVPGPEAPSLANAPSFRAMKSNVSMRFKDFVRAI